VAPFEGLDGAQRGQEARRPAVVAVGCAAGRSPCGDRCAVRRKLAARLPSGGWLNELPTDAMRAKRPTRRLTMASPRRTLTSRCCDGLRFFTPLTIATTANTADASPRHRHANQAPSLERTITGGLVRSRERSRARPAFTSGLEPKLLEAHPPHVDAGERGREQEDAPGATLPDLEKPVL